MSYNIDVAVQLLPYGKVRMQQLAFSEQPSVECLLSRLFGAKESCQQDFRVVNGFVELPPACLLGSSMYLLVLLR
jgi:hypothetical protein